MNIKSLSSLSRIHQSQQIYIKLSGVMFIQTNNRITEFYARIPGQKINTSDSGNPILCSTPALLGFLHHK